MAVAALKPRHRASRSASLLPGTVVREVGQQKLLATRICDLNLRPEGILEECVEQVIGELQRKGITFVPAYYLGDDDFWTADRAVSVNIPWYLANPELWRLVNDHLFEYTREEVLMYLRHEAGHAINYAFELWRRKDWTQTFGDFRRPYRDVYNPQPVEPRLRPLPPPRGHVPLRAEASGRGLGRDVRGLAGGRTVAAPLPRLAGRAGQARVRRPHRRHRARLPRQPRQRPPRHARPVHGDQGDGRRLLRHQRQPRPGPAGVPATICSRSSRAGRRARAPSPRAGCSRAPRTRSRPRASSSSTRTSSPTASSAGSATATSARSASSCASCRRSAPPSTWSFPTACRTEKLIELTVVATWHVVDGIHRLS